MKTAIATVSISGELPEKLEAIAAAGFDGVEIFENDFLAYDEGPRQVAKMARDAGLEISLFQPFRDFEGLPEPYRQRAFDRAERKFDLMGELGADLVLICSNVSPAALGGIDRAAADLAELGARAQKRGIRIGYEALAWGRFVNDHRDAWEIVRRADHPNVGLMLDSFHTLARGVPVDSIRSIPKDKIFFIQLADAPRINMDLLYWSRHFRNLPGQGDLDVLGFMRAVAATGYDGTLSLEIFNDQFRGGAPKVIATDGHRSLIYLMDQVRRAEPKIAIEVPDLPARVPVEGFEFVEFAAAEDEAHELADLLKTLGFTHVANHISKNVTLWRQGDINIVINTEQEGFAHAAYVVHGTCVCDIGLRVDDANAVVTRAETLGAKLFTQPVGPGELPIPAIRGVSGGVMHFIDAKSELSDVWEREFKPVGSGDAATTANVLSRIDHVAQTMNYEEMLTWVLFYTSIFETQKSPMVDIVDPAGLVRSQVIEDEGGRFRLTLNGAENRRTLAGHFISETFGSTVQHIAFATDDLFKCLDQLTARGFAPLKISPNYYDDLAARLGLSEAFVERLRQANILYDQNETGGEFFQVYSKSYDDRFFFEIVERRGDYRGYGATNAPFRIAAQQRVAGVAKNLRALG